MKFVIYAVASLVVVISMVLIAFSVASRKQPELGLQGGQLQVCPATPNCVCSEYPDETTFIEPLRYTTTTEQAWDKLKQVVAETGGSVIKEEAGYLHVVYETPLLRFMDDVEFRLDSQSQRLHVRSASRVGKSDLGANRERVEKIRRAFNP
ncbi:MAG: DUF1499 domain-containing protein [Gammaproteobacteria bacterium]|jgi:uncharacterized protein (DUF1499 family)